MDKIYGFLMSVLLAGCATLEGAESTAQGKQTKLNKQADIAIQKMDWINYADPVADANMAIEKGQFHVLAVSNKGLSVPGINLSDYSIEELQVRCKVKQVATGGDAIYSKSQLEKRKSVVTYVKAYNQIVLPACISKTN